MELYSRRQLRFYHAGQSGGQVAAVPLRGLAAWLATVTVSLVVWFAFLWPSLALFRWSIVTPEAWLSLDYLQLLGNSISLAGGSVVVVVSVAMILVYGLRQGLVS